MFATATLLASHANAAIAIPAAAILHLHDRAFIFEPTVNAGGFKRVEVKTGNVLDGNMVEVLSGLQPGQQVVANALDLQNTADQQ